jgi:hypothetical protein
VALCAAVLGQWDGDLGGLKRRVSQTGLGQPVEELTFHESCEPEDVMCAAKLWPRKYEQRRVPALCTKHLVLLEGCVTECKLHQNLLFGDFTSNLLYSVPSNSLLYKARPDESLACH